MFRQLLSARGFVPRALFSEGVRKFPFWNTGSNGSARQRNADGFSGKTGSTLLRSFTIGNAQTGYVMADENKIGRPWSDEELDAIVADYFSMLSEELAGRPYVKSRHSAALMAEIGRTHRSVEFKHQNISAVMDDLGMPWICGYIPKRNYQNAIFDAIDRYLSRHPDVLLPAARHPSIQTPSDIFISTPTLEPPGERIPERLRRLVRKFDPVERDHHNRSLGKAGEEFVFDLERRNLTERSR